MTIRELQRSRTTIGGLIQLAYTFTILARLLNALLYVNIKKVKAPKKEIKQTCWGKE